MQRGTLFLIVGPSGAGKDSVIAGLRQRLADRPIRFVRRTVTRPPGPGEDHEPVDEVMFAARQAAGWFALAWAAHGLSYGIPADIDDDLTAGRHVVANVSRSVLGEASGRFSPLLALEITASPAILAARIVARGREDASAVAQRLTRPAPVIDPGVPLVSIDNSGPIEAAVARVAALLA